MAKNDMEVIIYKILAYLYRCNKEGKEPTLSDLIQTLEYRNIPLSYLSQIIEELVSEGYVSGIRANPTKDGKVLSFDDDARITFRGVQFLNENSRILPRYR